MDWSKGWVQTLVSMHVGWISDNHFSTEIMLKQSFNSIKQNMLNLCIFKHQYLILQRKFFPLFIIDCGDPAPLNGYSNTPEGTEFRATALVGCNSGYILNGNSLLTCLAGSVWSSAPECVRGRCKCDDTFIHYKLFQRV